MKIRPWIVRTATVMTVMTAATRTTGPRSLFFFVLLRRSSSWTTKAGIGVSPFQHATAASSSQRSRFMTTAASSPFVAPFSSSSRLAPRTTTGVVAVSSSSEDNIASAATTSTTNPTTTSNTTTTTTTTTRRSIIPPIPLQPAAISVRPGDAPVEEQRAKNPITEQSTILVVGASRGIGWEFVAQCLHQGATVVATHRSSHVPTTFAEFSTNTHHATEEDADTPPPPPQRFHTLQMDVAEEASIVRAAQEVQRRQQQGGLGPLTHIIHNAGIYRSGTSYDGTARAGRGAAPIVTKEDMLQSFEINTIGPMLIAQHFVPLMIATNTTAPTTTTTPVVGVLAFVTSKVGSIEDNTSGGAYAYRSSKSALNCIAKSLSVDLWDENIRVVLLHPGWVRTAMTEGRGLIATHTSVTGMLHAIENTDATTDFRFVDYKACLIPW